MTETMSAIATSMNAKIVHDTEMIAMEKTYKEKHSRRSTNLALKEYTSGEKITRRTK